MFICKRCLLIFSVAGFLIPYSLSARINEHYSDYKDEDKNESSQLTHEDDHMKLEMKPHDINEGDDNHYHSSQTINHNVHSYQHEQEIYKSSSQDNEFSLDKDASYQVISNAIKDEKEEEFGDDENEEFSTNELPKVDAVIMKKNTSESASAKQFGGCTAPWLSIGSLEGCFLFVQTRMNWDNARSICQSKGGDLIILDTESKRRHLIDFMEIYGLRNGHRHLGANDRSGSWRWMNGESVTNGWRVLGTQQPDDDQGDDTCMYLYGRPYPSGRYDLLSDWRCTSRRSFICEKQACVDLSRHCATHASQCDINTYVQRRCKKTCKLCGGCGEVYITRIGVIEHPLSGDYLNDENCVWKINAAEPITITFVRFDLETDYDFLYIRNGPSGDSPLLGTFTGNTTNPVETTQNSAFIRFSSDSSFTKTGFKLRWEPALECGEVYTTSNGGIKYPLSGDYLNNEDCVWKINAAEPIKITFVRFDLETYYDFLYVRNGPSSDSPLLGTFTGNTTNPVETTQNSAFIHFSSDYGITKTGFELRWEPALGCGEVYTTRNGEIEHPLSGDYLNNEDCVWKINAAEPIKITFVRFDLETDYDFLYVRNGTSSDSPLLGTFTGTTTNPVYTTQNSAFIRFSSDSSNTKTGFKLRWEPALGCPVGFFHTAGSSQCYKFYNDIERSYWEAKGKCQAEGLVLPEPSNPISLRNYLVKTYGTQNHAYVWLGSRGTGSYFIWERSGRKISNSDFLWWNGDPGSRVSTSYCNLLLSNKFNILRQPYHPYHSHLCSNKWYTLCEYA